MELRSMVVSESGSLALMKNSPWLGGELHGGANEPIRQGGRRRFWLRKKERVPVGGGCSWPKRILEPMPPPQLNPVRCGDCFRSPFDIGIDNDLRFVWWIVWELEPDMSILVRATSTFKLTIKLTISTY
jgi:hypothetical protein